MKEASAPLPPDYRPGTIVDLYLDGLTPPREDAARVRGLDGTWSSQGWPRSPRVSVRSRLA